MCQLLGMSCLSPADFCFSFRGFAARGGRTDKHKDGWGVAFYLDNKARTYIDVRPACESALAAQLWSEPIKTYTMIAHIRLATAGAVRLENAHPYVRSLWGRDWTFAHNGDVPREHLRGLMEQQTQRLYVENGDTDSEAAFCYILNELSTMFPDTMPPLSELYTVFSALCNSVASADGAIFNMLMSDGRHIFTSCWPGRRPESEVWNGLHYIVRQAPFTRVHSTDIDEDCDYSTVTSDCMSVIATKPLTDNESWVEMQRGDFIVFKNGRPLRSKAECEASETSDVLAV